MDRLRQVGRLVCIEPAMALYMISTFVRMPVFQAMLYEKICYHEFGTNSTVDCTDTSHLRHLSVLHEEFNHVFLASSLCLLVPSLFFTIVLGSLMDTWSLKKPLIIPLLGLLLADFNDILQASYITLNPYLVVVGDVMFGLFGGYSAIIGTMFSYSMRVTDLEQRSERVAMLEGAIGLGATLGSLLSGMLRQATSYFVVYLFDTFLHLLAIAYLAFFAHEPPRSHNEDDVPPMTSIVSEVTHRVRDYARIFSAPRPGLVRPLLLATLVALCLELVTYAGVSDILFSFLLRRLNWTDKEFGVFRSVSSALGCLLILFLYPTLHKRAGVSNSALVVLGMLMKVAFLVVLAFSHTPWLTFATVLPQGFSRFVATGLRAMVAQFVNDSEQGRIFALIASIESLSSIVATSVFNGLYPLTLHTFDGLMFLATALAILIPLVIILVVRHKMVRMSIPHTESEHLNAN